MVLVDESERIWMLEGKEKEEGRRRSESQV